MIILPISKTKEIAILPQYATVGSACFDMFTPVPVTIPAGGYATVNLHLKVEVPHAHALYIDSRSGHGFKHGVRLANGIGIVDSDYRGEICVCLHNDRKEDVHLARGVACAQGWVSPTPSVLFQPIPEEMLTTTERGEGGFGSTDKA